MVALMAVAHCARGIPSADTLVVIICLCVLAEQVKQHAAKNEQLFAKIKEYFAKNMEQSAKNDDSQFNLIRKLITQKHQMSEDFFAMEERFKCERKQWVKLPRSESVV